MEVLEMLENVSWTPIGQRLIVCTVCCLLLHLDCLGVKDKPEMHTLGVQMQEEADERCKLALSGQPL